jgi:hypothetical protein
MKSADANSWNVERRIGWERKRARKGPFPVGPAFRGGNTSPVAGTSRRSNPERGAEAGSRWFAIPAVQKGQPGRTKQWNDGPRKWTS